MEEERHPGLGRETQIGGSTDRKAIEQLSTAAAVVAKRVPTAEAEAQHI